MEEHCRIWAIFWICERALKCTPHHGQNSLLDFHSSICPFVRNNLLQVRRRTTHPTHHQRVKIELDTATKPHSALQQEPSSNSLCESILVDRKTKQAKNPTKQQPEIFRKPDLHISVSVEGGASELTILPPPVLRALCLFRCYIPFWTAQQMGAVGF